MHYQPSRNKLVSRKDALAQTYHQPSVLLLKILEVVVHLKSQNLKWTGLLNAQAVSLLSKFGQDGFGFHLAKVTRVGFQMFGVKFCRQTAGD